MVAETALTGKSTTRQARSSSQLNERVYELGWMVPLPKGHSRCTHARVPNTVTPTTRITAAYRISRKNPVREISMKIKLPAATNAGNG